MIQIKLPKADGTQDTHTGIDIKIQSADRVLLKNNSQMPAMTIELQQMKYIFYQPPDKIVAAYIDMDWNAVNQIFSAIAELKIEFIESMLEDGSFSNPTQAKSIIGNLRRVI